ncbi:MAG TPA: IS1380 family transposase [Solirubrobacteraceae bacterium]
MPDGEGLVSHAGSALLARVAEKTGLTRALSRELAGLKQRRSGHDQGRVICDLAVMLGDGGDCLADLGALGDQEALFGSVASASTAFRLIDRIASDPVGLERLRGAHAQARACVWKLTGAPEHLTIDLDATLIGSHSEKEGAAGNFKGGYGFHPMLAYADETGESLAGELRPGNAGANTAADQIAVAEQAIGQIPGEHIQDIKLLLRVDCAGSSHELLDWCREGAIEFSVGYELNEGVRAAIAQIPDSDWVSALNQDGGPRPNGQVCEITASLDLAGWPTGSRVIVRRERAHPGAQLSFTDHDGHRFQAILTDQPGEIAQLEREHRGRARVEDHIRNDKDTGMRNLPFRDFEHNRVWLQIVRIAHDLISWTQRLLLTGELARCEPKRLRYRILHVAARLAFHARTATLRIQASWPWATDLTVAFGRLRALPTPPV